MSNQNHESKALKVRIEGRVQGVGFRYFVYKHARRKGVRGWVKNLDDGRVEAYFEGDQNQLDSIVELCRQGPAGSKVKDLQAESLQPTGRLKNFDFKYD
jgi:acylphosphatase